MEEYRITKEQCESGINGICTRCGKSLVAIETVDNARNPTYWSGCDDCMCFDNGVSQQVYDISKIMVTERHFRPYTCDEKMSDDEETKMYKQKQQISGACRIVEQIAHLLKQCPS